MPWSLPSTLAQRQNGVVQPVGESLVGNGTHADRRAGRHRQRLRNPFCQIAASASATKIPGLPVSQLAVAT